ncbi:MAG TPA: hypothetical protein VMR06_03850 [Dokdonella sp.]|uniref:hypothetical protein n=1 Tax=Dokdonella sp. TaxID=2291710 RepID=UPI002C3D816C|nr:hypothetical protein [Dokdonella sp.]HUD41111.1 hypothetical protein [Dokdonella sp.]
MTDPTAACDAERAAFRFVAHGDVPSAEDVAAVLAFWTREGAIAEAAVREARVREVVLHARDAAGEVAGVCTARPLTLAQIGQPLYYWRTFVGARWRTTRLAYALLQRSFALLEAQAATRQPACIGVLLELENPRFRDRGRAPVWRNGYVYVGRSPRGLELRVRYFRGARLLPPTPASAPER